MESLPLFEMPIGAVPSRSGTTQTCPECLRPFEPYKRAEGRQVYCSDPCRGKAWKAQGKALAADRNADILATFRAIARELAQSGDVSIDEVRAEAEARGIQYEPGNWMGSLFNEPGWVFVRYRRATHASAHARPVGVWRLS